jgi:hypothetical protein
MMRFIFITIVKIIKLKKNVYEINQREYLVCRWTFSREHLWYNTKEEWNSTVGRCFFLLFGFHWWHVLYVIDCLSLLHVLYCIARFSFLYIVFSSEMGLSSSSISWNDFLWIWKRNSQNKTCLSLSLYNLY